MENNWEEKKNKRVNLRLENSFDDEYFTLINGIDDFLFADKIYVSNYGEVYNKNQEKLFHYEPSSINLRLVNGVLKSFSRWSLTAKIFEMSNIDYETRRRVKKLSYGYNIQNGKKHRLNKKNKLNIGTDSCVDNNEENIHNECNNFKNKINYIIDPELNSLELELNKYKFIYSEILNQKINLEIKIQELENRIKLAKDMSDKKYENTLIYIIRPKHNNFYMYIGHTIDKDRRLKEHMRSTDNDNKKLYKTIRETGGWEHWEMIEIGRYNCKCKEDALKIEQEWCEKLRPNLNSTSPFA